MRDQISHSKSQFAQAVKEGSAKNVLKVNPIKNKFWKTKDTHPSRKIASNFIRMNL